MENKSFENLAAPIDQINGEIIITEKCQRTKKFFSKSMKKSSLAFHLYRTLESTHTIFLKDHRSTSYCLRWWRWSKPNLLVSLTLKELKAVQKFNSRISRGERNSNLLVSHIIKDLKAAQKFNSNISSNSNILDSHLLKELKIVQQSNSRIWKETRNLNLLVSLIFKELKAVQKFNSKISRGARILKIFVSLSKGTKNKQCGRTYQVHLW